MKKMMRHLIPLLAAIIFSGTLTAGIEMHFKKPTNKTGNHQMRNVDFIYMINLDQRPEKFANCTKQLHPYGIYPFRFSAVNGWELTLDAINDVGVKYKAGMKKNLLGTTYLPEGGGEQHHEIMHKVGRTYFCHCTARGTIGITLSHLSVLQDAYDSGYETIWVMEDDIEVIQDPHQISALIDKLDRLVGKKGWDILFTDKDIKNLQGAYVPCSGYAKRPDFSPENPERFAIRTQAGADFMKIGSRYGCHSMIIRRSGMKKLLDFLKRYQMFLPIDMDMFLPSKMRFYSVMNDVVSNKPGALSDNGAPNFKKS